MELSSSSFAHGGPIPVRHTCDGANVSPGLSWSGIPEGTQSLALIVDDPDAPDPNAPKRIWVHWLLYNLPPTVHELREGQSNHALPAPAREGLNDGGTPGYAGPCPPIGRHRYFHTLYALDTILPDLGPHTTRKSLDAAMKGHIVGSAQLMGTYQR